MTKRRIKDSNKIQLIKRVDRILARNLKLNQNLKLRHASPCQLHESNQTMASTKEKTPLAILP